MQFVRLTLVKAWGRLAIGAMILLGIGAVLALSSATGADNDGQTVEAPQQRLSGAERSAIVLREIKDLLERMDARVQRLDENVARLTRAQGNPQEPLPAQQEPLQFGGGARQ